MAGSNLQIAFMMTLALSIGHVAAASACELDETYTDENCRYRCEQLYGVDGTPSFKTWSACEQIGQTDPSPGTEGGTTFSGETSRTQARTEPNPKTHPGQETGNGPSRPGAAETRPSTASPFDQQEGFCRLAVMNYVGVALALQSGRRAESLERAKIANEDIRRAKGLGSSCRSVDIIGFKGGRGDGFLTDELKARVKIGPERVVSYVQQLAASDTLPSPIASARKVVTMAESANLRTQMSRVLEGASSEETAAVQTEEEHAEVVAEETFGISEPASVPLVTTPDEPSRTPAQLPSKPVLSDRSLDDLEYLMKEIAQGRFPGSALDQRLSEVSIFQRVRRVHRHHETELKAPELDLR